ncbi:MAG: hypothetical protein ABI768_08985 [Acidobacteriota bacterium]
MQTGGIFVLLTSDHTSVLVVPSFWVGEGATSWGGVVSAGIAATSTLVTVQASCNGVIKTAMVTVTPREPVRGVAGDLWADIILGKPDFTEVTYNEVSSRRVFNARGVLVDRSVAPNRVYVFDSGNSRVLGLSHLGACASGVKVGQPCTANSDCPGSTCAIQEGRGADLVLGQPSLTRSACNGDGAFQRFPVRAPASAATLCSMPEEQISLSEQLIGANMAVDGAGNLYVPDSQNNRVLRYDSPFTTDAIADDVWGQADFTGRDCNRARGPSPDNEGLCFRSPLGLGFVDGVAIDPGGNLWITDNANNRVLRFPFDSGTGRPGHVADLVLGQPDFASSADGSGLNQMWGPAAVRVDGAGSVYVADSQNARVLVFDPPLVSGQTARRMGIDFGAVPTGNFGTPTGLEFDSAGGLWINDTFNNQFLYVVGGSIQKVLGKKVPSFTGECGPDDFQTPPFFSGDGTPGSSWLACGSAGSIGVDGDGNVLVSKMDDVLHFPAPIPPPGTEVPADAQIFKPYQFNVQNEAGLAGTYTPSGVVVASGQLIVADRGRLLYWNNPPILSNGQSADGYVGTTDPRSHPAWEHFGRVRQDGRSRLWATWVDKIRVYSLPLHTGDNPITTIAPPLPVLGGGSVSWDDRILVGGLAPDAAGDKVWVVDNVGSRVFRIRTPFTSPTVDIVLGQTSVSGTDCNQGQGSTRPSRTSLCFPASIRLDPSGNLYVSDSGGEAQGNLRLLEFDAALFPASPSQALFGIPASRVFGTGGSFTVRGCSGSELCADFREPGFSSNGQMVAGGGGYANSPFPSVYTNPLVNPQAGAFLNDYYSCPDSAAFDSSNNLYVTDACRARVLVYLNPLSSFPPNPPSPTNDGPVCEGDAIHLFVGSVSGATYSWTGPNGFTSALQSPTIPSATAANAGTYSVTVSMSGSTSAPGATVVVVNPVPATPFVTAPGTVAAASPDWTASVPGHAGSTYSWSVSNGTITAGQGTNQITFTAGSAGTPLRLSVTEAGSAGCVSGPGTATLAVVPVGSAARFYVVPPCRQLDTRIDPRTPIAAAGSLTVPLVGAPCGIPSGAAAVSANLTVTLGTAQGFLTILPADVAQPVVSNINFNVGQTRANNAILRLSGDGTGRITVFNGSAGTVHVIVDVNGYFR